MSTPRNLPIAMQKLAQCILFVAFIFVLAGVGHGADQAESAGVKVGKKSSFTNLVPASTIERSAAQQYAQLISQARQQQALAPNEHPDEIGRAHV